MKRGHQITWPQIQISASQGRKIRICLCQVARVSTAHHVTVQIHPETQMSRVRTRKKQFSFPDRQMANWATFQDFTFQTKKAVPRAGGKIKRNRKRKEEKKNSAVAVQRDILKSLMNKSYFCLKRGCSFSIASQPPSKYADKERWMGTAVSESAYKDLSFAGGDARSRN